MTSEILAALGTANLAAAAAIAAVFALRLPARRWLGARAAYALWLIVPLAMAATFLPARITVITPPPPATLPAPVAYAIEVLQPVTLSADTVITSQISAPALDLRTLILAAWLAGIAAYLLLLFVGQRRALARFGALQPQPGRVARASNPGVGPALLGVFRPLLIVPADFEARFDGDERAMILAHERAHLKSGHTLINGAAALLRALNWFNPLIHIAGRLMRIDQELACDAAVAAAHPGQRQTYARALMKSQLAAAPLPFGCYWPEPSQSRLEQRIALLAANTSRRRQVAGAAIVAVLATAGGVTAWAAQAPRIVVAPSPGPVISTSHEAAVLAAPKKAIKPASGDVARYKALLAPDQTPVQDTPPTRESALLRGDYLAAARLGASAADIVRAEQAKGRLTNLDPGAAEVVISPDGKVLRAYAMRPLPALPGETAGTPVAIEGNRAGFAGPPGSIIIGPPPAVADLSAREPGTITLRSTTRQDPIILRNLTATQSQPQAPASVTTPAAPAPAQRPAAAPTEIVGWWVTGPNGERIPEFQARFDANAPVMISGVVSKVEWINPRTLIHITTNDPRTPEWTIFGGTPNTLGRSGVDREVLKPGALVTIAAYRSKQASCPVDPTIRKPSCHANGRTLYMTDGRTLFIGRSGEGAPNDSQTAWGQAPRIGSLCITVGCASLLPCRGDDCTDRDLADFTAGFMRVEPDGRHIVVLVRGTEGGSVYRTLAIGDVFGDGWTMTAISLTRVTIARGGDTRAFEVIPSRAPLPLPKLPEGSEPRIMGITARPAPATLRPLSPPLS